MSDVTLPVFQEDGSELWVQTAGVGFKTLYGTQQLDKKERLTQGFFEPQCRLSLGKTTKDGVCLIAGYSRELLSPQGLKGQGGAGK